MNGSVKDFKLKFPYFLALDVDDKDKALSLSRDLAPFVGGFKIGPRLCLRYGQDLILQIAKFAPVFIDNKYYDIPSSMEAAVESSFHAGASFCTVHAASGAEALKKMFALEKKLLKIRFFKILVVTILTSFDEKNKPSHWSKDSLEGQTQKLMEDVLSSGLKGLVCSANNLTRARSLSSDFFLVTPGIRSSADAGSSENLGVQVVCDDQKQIMSPQKALMLGSDALVIGRPILLADSPIAMAQKISLLVSD